MDTNESATETAPVATNLHQRWREYSKARFEDLFKNCSATVGRQEWEGIVGTHLLESMLLGPNLDDTPSQNVLAASGPSLTRMRPALLRIQRFIHVLTEVVDSECHRVDVIWSVMSCLTIKLSRYADLRQHPAAAGGAVKTRVDDFMDQLERMAHSLENMSYYEWILATSVEIGDVIIEAFVSLMTYLAHVIRYLNRAIDEREIPKDRQASAVSDTAWQIVNEIYADNVGKNDERVQQLMTKANALQQNDAYTFTEPPEGRILHDLEIRGTFETSDAIASNSVDNMRLPCHTIPMTKNPRYFQREGLMAIVREHLDYSELTPEFRTFTLWGMPGIGKTQTALAYAHECRESGLFSQIFWIDSETPMAILESFTRIAVKLGLKGAKQNEGHEDNKRLVLYWLQEALVPWLMIFDNVEDPASLTGCWPVATRGSILITARDSLLSEHTASSCQVPSLTADEGSDFVMKMLGKAYLSPKEQQSAQMLSEVLQGWPLALFQTSQNIRLGRKTIEKHLKDCEREPKRLRDNDRPLQNAQYAFSIQNVFKKSFQLLDLNSAALLETICFIAPVGIPEDMFEHLTTEHLPTDLSFCGNPTERDRALAELLGTSLIDKDAASQDISIHRLVQELYREYIGPAQRYRRFLSAAKLLRGLFPAQEKGRSLRNRFGRCSMYLGHVIALSDRCREFGIKAEETGDLQDFCELIASCAWYLKEIGSWTQFFRLAHLAYEVCEDRESLLYAKICNVIGCVQGERGHAADGRPYMETAMSIRERLLPENHEDLSDIYNNYANIINLEWETDAALESALQYYQKAIDIDSTKPPAERNQVLHVRHINFGTLYTCQGRWSLATEQLEIAQKYCVESFGSEKHWDATAEYKLGNVLYFQEQWQAARQKFERALRIFRKEDKLHPATTATQLKLATIMIKLGDPVAAIDMLNEAIPIVELNEAKKGDKGDLARFVRRLADALEASGDHEQATAKRLEAESYRREVQGSRYERLEDCERSYSLMVFKAFW